MFLHRNNVYTQNYAYCIIAKWGLQVFFFCSFICWGGLVHWSQHVSLFSCLIKVKGLIYFMSVSICGFAKSVFCILGSPDYRYIRVETCMFMVKLPQYSTLDVMLEKLRYAIHYREDPLSGWRIPKHKFTLAQKYHIFMFTHNQKFSERLILLSSWVLPFFLAWFLKHQPILPLKRLVGFFFALS